MSATNTKVAPRPEWGRRLLRGFGKAALVLFLVLLLVVDTTMIAGALAKSALRAAYPPPGQMVEVDGHRLHLFCQGEGSPTVVMDAGQGDIGLTWSLVQPEISHDTRVCVYDRGGLGWSDPASGPRRPGIMAEELHKLLESGGVPGPYLLVGHSLGGLVVRLYASSFPGEVAGLVLVDAAHEEQFTPLPVRRSIEGMIAPMAWIANGLRFWVGVGFPALIPALLPGAGIESDRFPEETMDAYRALLASRPDFVHTRTAEFFGVVESADLLRATQGSSLGDIPVIVLRHGVVTPQMGGPEVTQALADAHARSQQKMAALSPRGRLVVVEDSDHNIHHNRPDVVIGAIREVLAAAR